MRFRSLVIVEGELSSLEDLPEVLSKALGANLDAPKRRRLALATMLRRGRFKGVLWWEATGKRPKDWAGSAKRNKSREAAIVDIRVEAMQL